MSASDATDWLDTAAAQLKFAAQELNEASHAARLIPIAHERIAAAREYARLAAIDKGLPDAGS